MSDVLPLHEGLVLSRDVVTPPPPLNTTAACVTICVPSACVTICDSSACVGQLAVFAAAWMECHPFCLLDSIFGIVLLFGFIICRRWLFTSSTKVLKFCMEVKHGP